MKVRSSKGKNNPKNTVEDLIVSKNIPMPQVNATANIKDCEHCIKKDVCKYKERVEEAMEYLNNLNHEDERFANIPLVIDIRCKEFNIGYTGVR